ncbi:MAG: DUF3592 domain-containing protein [Anaerolineales bacterium]|nr:DUF3592 domain-containing protein [Anaerolineales bacterium]
MIGQLDPEKLRANQRLMNKRGKIIGIAMMAGSALITLVFALFAWQSIESYNWPETDGVVTYASYTGALDSKNDRSYFDYEYSVDGMTYQGKESDKGTFADVPPKEGETIKVYYNPSNPGDSRVGSNRGNALNDMIVWVCCAGPAFFFFGAVFLFVSTRKQEI